MTEYKVEAWTKQMLDLLMIEREAEVEETAELLQKYSFKELEKRSLAITKLYVK